MAKTNGDDYVANEIETAGIIRDDFGNSWTLPTNPELGEDLDFDYSPLALPKLDPRFHYQFVKTDKELAQSISERFVPVRRSEVGLSGLNDSNLKLKEYGVNTQSLEDPIHQVGDLTLVKIPMEFRKMRLARAAKEADFVKSTIEPPKADEPAKARLREAHEHDGQKLVEDVVSRVEIVRPRNENA